MDTFLQIRRSEVTRQRKPDSTPIDCAHKTFLVSATVSRAHQAGGKNSMPEYQQSLHLIFFWKEKLKFQCFLFLLPCTASFGDLHSICFYQKINPSDPITKHYPPIDEKSRVNLSKTTLHICSKTYNLISFSHTQRINPKASMRLG